MLINRRLLVPYRILFRLGWIAPVILWSVFLWREARYAGFDVSDMYGHESLVHLLLNSWKSGTLGLDAWHNGCCLGSAVFRTYQHLGHFLAAGLTYILGLPTPSIALHALVVLAILVQCPAFFAAARILGFSRRVACHCAWLAPLISCIFPLGHEFFSYLFIGHGLFTQALAMPAYVLALAHGIRVISDSDVRNPLRDGLVLGFWFALAFALHHLCGYLIALPLILLGIVGLAGRWKSPRYYFFCAIVVGGIFLLINGYQLLSILQDTTLMRRGEIDPVSRWDGWGGGRYPIAS